jgi:hypothetical protein
MPEVRQLKKPPQAEQKKIVERPPVTQVPREPVIQKFTANSMHLIGQDYAILTITAPNGMTYENALIPEAWVNVCRRVVQGADSRRREWLGSIIHLYSPTHAWFAHLYIRAIVYDKFKQPCGLQVSCVGPSIDLKTGKAMPINVATGLPWIDPKEDIEEAA